MRGERKDNEKGGRRERDNRKDTKALRVRQEAGGRRQEIRGRESL
jgi:hypothetical protein